MTAVAEYPLFVGPTKLLYRGGGEYRCQGCEVEWIDAEQSSGATRCWYCESGQSTEFLEVLMHQADYWMLVEASRSTQETNLLYAEFLDTLKFNGVIATIPQTCMR